MTIICSSCGSPCTGEVLKVQDKHFHINCFKCHECGTLLASGGYFPRNDHYYCSKDYHRLFGTKCKSCGEFVEGRVITALGNSYHPECFTCDRCGGEIRSGTVVTYNDKEEILCQNCSPDVTLSDTPPLTSPSPPTNTDSAHPPAPPTSTHQDSAHQPAPPTHSTPKETIRNKTTNNNTINIPKSDHTSSLVSSMKLHDTHTTTTATNNNNNTTTGGSGLDEVFDFSKVPDIDSETKPYLGKCAQCQEVIRSAQSLIALSRHWHLFCFSCARCKRYLTNEYMDNGDQAYCEPCFQELYGLICETCQEYITGTVLEAGDCHFHPSCAFCCKCNSLFTEGDDLCISAEEVWHLDCERAKGRGVAVAGSLPPHEATPTSTPPPSSYPSRPYPNITRPSSENYTRNIRTPSSRASPRMTPDSFSPPVIYPLKDLQLIGKVCLPKSVNRTKLEQHLSDTDFLEAFGMDRNTFYTKPQWKQIELKKKANLF